MTYIKDSSDLSFHKDIVCGSGVKVDKSEIFKPIEIGDNTKIGPNVVVGRYTKINRSTEIRSTSMGRFCSIGANNYINPFNHPTDWLSTHEFQYPSQGFCWSPEIWNIKKLDRSPKMSVHSWIGSDVWTGHNVVIMGNVGVGDGAIIGANSVVTHDVEPYSIVAGAPAKLIKYRFSKINIERLLKLKWWDKPLSELQDLPFDDIEACLAKLESFAREDSVREYME